MHPFLEQPFISWTAHPGQRKRTSTSYPGEDFIARISAQGFDPQFGARPVKRMIQKELLNELSRQIIAGTLEPGHPQVIDVFDGKIVFRKPIDEKEQNGNRKKKAKAEV